MDSSVSRSCTVIALLVIGAAVLTASPRSAYAVPAEDDISDEIWVDGPEAVQVGSSRSYPDVGVANSGMRVHVWSEGGIGGSAAGEIILRRFDAEGNPLEDPKQVNTTTDDIQRHARVAVSTNGTFLVIWQSWENGPAERVVVRSRLYNPDGTPAGPEQRVSTVLTNIATDASADVAALRAAGGAAGGYAVVWASNNSAGSDTGTSIQGCLISAAGVPGAQFQVNSTDSGSQNYASVAELNDGGFLTTWTVDKQVWGRRFNAAGGPIGNDFQISTSAAVSRYDNDAAIGWDGRLAVVWSDADPIDTGKEIHARLFDADLNPLGPDFRVNTLTSGAQEVPRVADFGPKGFLVVWQSVEASGADLGDSIEARIVTGPDEFDGQQFQLNVWDNNNNQTLPGAHGWYGRLATTWRSLTWDGQPPPNNINSNFIIGRDVEYCIMCEDFEWYDTGGTGNLWRWEWVD